MAMIDVGIVVQTTGSGVINGFHTYADNGKYTVTNRFDDDDMRRFAPGHSTAACPMSPPSRLIHGAW